MLGELDTRVLLEQYGASSVDAQRVASGWSGDSWQLVETDGHSGIAVKSSWDSAASAAAFFSTYAKGLRTRFGSAAIDASTPTHEALTTPDHATDVSLTGQTVLAVIATDRDTAEAMVAAVTSSDP